jgi:cation diffusion facilitator family transporter
MVAVMAQESKTAVVAAIVGNAAIAAIKFAAAALTGSSAMISEGIHSVVDTGNGGLLLYGLRRGNRPIVAVSIFGIGGGMSIYEGVMHIRHPSPMANPMLNYIVLGAAMVFEGISFSVAWRAFRKHKRGRGTVAAIHQGKDPSLFTILFEDTAALLGLAVAFIGVLLSHLLRAPVFDAAASVVIGCILVSAALWLAYETKSLLVGEAADPGLVAVLREIALADEAVDGLGSVLTMHLGPNEVLLNIEVQFKPDLAVPEVQAAIRRIEQRIATTYPQVNRIFVEVSTAHQVPTADQVTRP